MRVLGTVLITGGASADTAAAVLFALRQPVGSEIREMVVCASEESSWP